MLMVSVLCVLKSPIIMSSGEEVRNSSSNYWNTGKNSENKREDSEQRGGIDFIKFIKAL